MENLDQVSPEQIAAARMEVSNLKPRGPVDNPQELIAGLQAIQQKYPWLDSFESGPSTIMGISSPGGSIIGSLLQLLGQHQAFPRYSAELEALWSTWKSLNSQLDTLNFQKASPERQEKAKKSVSDYYGNM